MMDPYPDAAPSGQRSTAAARRLFALALLALGILSLGAGEGPLPQTRRLRKAVTDKRLDTLASSIYRYYEDTLAWIPTYRALVERPSGVANWLGSYIAVRYTNSEDLRDRTIRDGWGRRIIFKSLGSYDAKIYSRGPDGIDNDGAGDDQSRTLNADMILWRVTKREMRVLNTMITTYNLHNTQHKLPPSFEGTYNQLRVRGYLPNTRPSWKRDYWKDGWAYKYDAVTGGHPTTIVRAYSPGRR